MNTRREGVFWDLIDVLDNAGFLSHIMIIGSWAEYLYVDYFNDDYVPNLKTHDIDVFYQNPFFEIEGAEKLRGLFKEAGFLFASNPPPEPRRFSRGISKSSFYQVHGTVKESSKSHLRAFLPRNSTICLCWNPCR